MSEESTDAEFLRDLSDRLLNLAPVAIGTDQYHCDRLREMASELEAKSASVLYWQQNLIDSEQGLARVIERTYYGEDVVQLYQAKVKKAAEMLLAPWEMFKPWKLPDGSEAPCPRYQHDCDSCLYMGQFECYDLWFCSSQKGTKVNSIIGRFGKDGEYCSADAPDAFAGPEAFITRARGTYYEACMRVAVRAGLYHGKYQKEYS